MKKKLMVIIGILAMEIAIFSVLIINERNTSLAIIGGADGPTTVFLAGTLGNGVLFAAILFGLIFLALGIILFKQIKRK